jgi:hypothetical protein
LTLPPVEEGGGPSFSLPPIEEGCGPSFNLPLLRRDPSGRTYHGRRDAAPSRDVLADLWPSTPSLLPMQMREGEA